jgi:pantoate--beta-alanine ligase
MLTVTTIAGVRARRAELDRLGRRVALVPTMGALHEGHLALVRRGRELADEVWASVFVNPTQFGPGEDFERYPRDLETDRRLLEAVGTALLFAPGVKEMYPRPPLTVVSLPGLAERLCGAYRPGHFAGVATVVAKLLGIARPEVAVFGAKDWQQVTVIRRMVADLDMPARIEVLPTIRETDGLAMSSRNAYLKPAERVAAARIYSALVAVKDAVVGGERDAAAVAAMLAERIGREPLLTVQYAEAVNPDTLERNEKIAGRVLLVVAVHAGTTRLIDNLLVEVPS